MSKRRTRPTVRTVPQYVYSQEESKWVEYKPLPKEEEEEEQKPIEFRIAQLNVLFDKRFGKVYKPNICYAEERYQKQLEIYEQLGATFINNNEVTEGYLNMVKNSTWIQNNFYLTRIEGYGEIMGNLMMSRVPFDDLFMVRLPTRKIESHVGVINKTVFCCSHLSAYMDNGEKRGRQLQHLYTVFDNQIPFKGKNVLIFGDLNFHREEEDKNIRDDYIDVWKHLNKDKKGYTFCARSNLMIKEMWPFAGYIIGIDSAGIQMRLDRWLMKIGKESEVKFGRMKIIANKLVHSQEDNPEEQEGEGEEEEEKELKPRKSNIFGDFIAMTVDYFFEKNLWRKKEEFLFPSDHFGLFCDMVM